MSQYKAPVQDIDFLLNHVFKLEAFCSQFPDLDDMDAETSSSIVNEAAKLCENVLAPINAEGDSEGCYLDGGQVRVPESFKEAYKVFNENAWGALGGAVDYGGMGMPKTLVSVVEEIVQGSNMAFGLAPMLTAGACLALALHGSEEMKQRYLPKLYSGEWSGTMVLTEAHAGTDLGLMRTKAEPQADGSYHITGSKIFITWGEHNMTDNIVHFVLAKLPDAPAGSRGISLFLVPKVMVDEQGSLGDLNGVSCGSIEEKMGIHGSPTCVMNFDSAKGWLIGEPNAGLACMFTMMNYERLVVGIQGLGVAERAYQSAKEYALERLQGRASLTGKDHKGPSPIIDHQDVRRMLLEAKCLNEAGRAFYVYMATWLDRSKYSADEDDKRVAEERVALLTPVVKAFLTDRSFDVCVMTQQVLGGHGYIREWGQEQCVRDARITQIYEGTNGVQAMDFTARKTIANEGRYVKDFVAEIESVISSLDTEALEASEINTLRSALNDLDEVTQYLVSSPSSEVAGAAACDYLDMVGYISYGYVYLLQLQALNGELSAAFSESKRRLAAYYFAKFMPITHYLKQRILAGPDLASAFSHDDF